MLISKISSLTSNFRVNPSKPQITNLIFKLHYKVTVVLLTVLFILVCSSEYFGDKISCVADEGLPPSIANTYCYFIGTFTIVRHYNEKLLEAGLLPHPGVGPRLKLDDVLVHQYYQWVPLILILQAICFYVPYSMWKRKEGGRMKSIADSLQLSRLALEDTQMTVDGKTVPSKPEIQKKLQLINADLFFRITLSRHWASWLIRAEVMNFLHIVLQIWITNIFLNGHFIRLGPMFFTSNWEMIADPLEYIFPKVTKCEFHKYGPSGTVQKYDALCVMALNIIHEKVYMVIWFWFLILLILSFLVLVWRLMMFCFYRRSFFMDSNANFFWKFNVSRYMKLNPHSGLKRDTYLIFMYLDYHDWLFLRYLSKNMHGFIFQELFRFLTDDIRTRFQINSGQRQAEKEEKEKEDLINIDNGDIPYADDDNNEQVINIPESNPQPGSTEASEGPSQPVTVKIIEPPPYVEVPSKVYNPYKDYKYNPNTTNKAINKINISKVKKFI